MGFCCKRGIYDLEIFVVEVCNVSYTFLVCQTTVSASAIIQYIINQVFMKYTFAHDITKLLRGCTDLGQNSLSWVLNYRPRMDQTQTGACNQKCLTTAHQQTNAWLVMSTGGHDVSAPECVNENMEPLRRT